MYVVEHNNSIKSSMKWRVVGVGEGLRNVITLFTFPATQHSVACLTLLLALYVGHLTLPGELTYLAEPALLADAAAAGAVAMTWGWGETWQGTGGHFRLFRA